MFTEGTDFYCATAKGFTYCNPKNQNTLNAVLNLQNQLLMLVNGVLDAAKERGASTGGFGALQVNPRLISTSGSPDGSVGNGTAILTAWALQSANELLPAPGYLLDLARQIGIGQAPASIFAPITANAEEIAAYFAQVNANFHQLYLDYLNRNMFTGQGANTPIEASAIAVLKEAVDVHSFWFWLTFGAAGAAVIGGAAWLALKHRKKSPKRSFRAKSGRYKLRPSYA